MVKPPYRKFHSKLYIQQLPQIKMARTTKITFQKKHRKGYKMIICLHVQSNIKRQHPSKPVRGTIRHMALGEIKQIE
jgi:hypothetical protein